MRDTPEPFVSAIRAALSGQNEALELAGARLGISPIERDAAAEIVTGQFDQRPHSSPDFVLEIK